jgi:hypothetical protein
MRQIEDLKRKSFVDGFSISVQLRRQNWLFGNQFERGIQRNKFFPDIGGYFFCEKLIIQKHNFPKIGFATRATMVSQVCLTC